MTHTRSLLLSITLTAMAGCGSVEEMGGAPDAGAGEADAAPTGPTVSIDPADGSRGVLVDQAIVLAFSEPMDTASVEAAWSSDSLPADQLVFEWNAAGDMLSVDASAVLDYPAGGIDVDPYSYDFTLEASATSAGGEALANAVTVGFQTARDISLELARVDSLTGGFDTNGVAADIRIGDTASNGTWRGFITVDLSDLPAVVDVYSAMLVARQTSVVGAPYSDLGDLSLVHLSGMTAIDQTAYAAVGTAVGVFSDSDAVGDRRRDVLDAIEADLDAGSQTGSFRLEFANGHDLGGDEDHVIFDPTSVRLDLRVLAE